MVLPDRPPGKAQSQCYLRERFGLIWGFLQHTHQPFSTFDIEAAGRDQMAGVLGSLPHHSAAPRAVSPGPQPAECASLCVRDGTVCVQWVDFERNHTCHNNDGQASCRGQQQWCKSSCFQSTACAPSLRGARQLHTQRLFEPIHWKQQQHHHQFSGGQLERPR